MNTALLAAVVAVVGVSMIAFGTGLVPAAVGVVLVLDSAIA